MYKLKVKDTIYTIPKENIILLAYTKMNDMHEHYNIFSEEKAIEYLNKIGIEVYE